MYEIIKSVNFSERRSTLSKSKGARSPLCFYLVASGGLWETHVKHPLVQITMTGKTHLGYFVEFTLL